ncbi:hypothetical protein HYV85_05740 [Candidatus Woesearchaeota archaeon]|nr:hypothetical protein [Candidatus Woesearchaeota archaeon]
MKTLKGIKSIKSGLEGIVNGLHSRASQIGSIDTHNLLGVAGTLLVFSGLLYFASFAVINMKSDNNFPEYHTDKPVMVGSDTRVRFYEPKGESYSFLVAAAPDRGLVTYKLKELPSHKLELTEVEVFPAGDQNATEGTGSKTSISYAKNSPDPAIAGFAESAGQQVDRYLAAIVGAKTSQLGPAAAGQK